MWLMLEFYFREHVAKYPCDSTESIVDLCKDWKAISVDDPITHLRLPVLLFLKLTDNPSVNTNFINTEGGLVSVLRDPDTLCPVALIDRQVTRQEELERRKADG